MIALRVKWNYVILLVRATVLLYAPWLLAFYLRSGITKSAKSSWMDDLGGSNFTLESDLFSQPIKASHWEHLNPAA